MAPNIIFIFKKPKKYDISVLESNPTRFVRRIFKEIFKVDIKDKEEMLERLLKYDKEIRIYIGRSGKINKRIIDILRILSRNKNLKFLIKVDNIKDLEKFDDLIKISNLKFDPKRYFNFFPFIVSGLCTYVFYNFLIYGREIEIIIAIAFFFLISLRLIIYNIK